MVVKIAIVDDESTAASLLEGCLHQYAEETGTAMQWEQFPDAEAFLKSDNREGGDLSPGYCVYGY